jgi:hypothetical protein
MRVLPVVDVPVEPVVVDMSEPPIVSVELPVLPGAGTPGVDVSVPVVVDVDELGMVDDGEFDICAFAAVLIASAAAPASMNLVMVMVASLVLVLVGQRTKSIDSAACVHLSWRLSAHLLTLLPRLAPNRAKIATVRARSRSAEDLRAATCWTTATQIAH